MNEKMNNIPRWWTTTLCAAVLWLLSGQPAWAQTSPTVTRSARSNTEFTFEMPTNNVQVTVEYVDAGAKITTAGESPTDLYYETLADAIADCANGDVITLLLDQTLTAGLSITKSITLDLNGKTLTGTAEMTGLTVGTGGALTLTATGGGGFSTFATAVKNEGTLTLSGTPTFTSCTNAFELAANKVITIGAALTAPASAYPVKINNNLPYKITSGFAANNNGADPASYFASTTAGVTTRLTDGEAEFVTYVALDADVAATVPVITNGGQDDDGERTASLDEGNVWIGDELTASTTATPGISWQWYRLEGTTETAIEGADVATYTVVTADLGKQLIAKATQPTNIAGIGHPASDVVVASAATAAVVKKDNFGPLTNAELTMDYIGVTIDNASTGVAYMVVADGVTPTEAHWNLATTPDANGSLKLNHFVYIDNEIAELRDMLPTTSYDLYYRLVETEDTKHGTTATTDGKPENERKADITTTTWTYRITTAGVTYKISEDPTATVTAKVVAIPATGDGTHKTATILTTIPANNTELTGRIDVWSVLGYNVTSAEVGTGVFNSNIAVVANQFDRTTTLTGIGSSVDTYGYLKAYDENMHAWLLTGTGQTSCTPEGYMIFNLNNGYYALALATTEGDTYSMAPKGWAIAPSGMSTILQAEGMSGGGVAFYDATGTELPIGTGLTADKTVAAPGQTVVVKVTLPDGFEFKTGADDKKISISQNIGEKELTQVGTSNVWTADFTMPAQDVTVSFVNASPIQGRIITVTVTVPTDGSGTITAATDNPTGDDIRIFSEMSYTLTPTAPAGASTDGYALTSLGLSEGITPTIVLASDGTTAVTLPSDQAVKVTFAIPATYPGNEVTFAPVFAKTYENVEFAAGMSTYYDSKGIALHGTNDNLKFYTVGSVSETGVTLTEISSKQIKANTPVIVNNATNDAITARMDLGTYDEVAFASQFKGSATATTLPFTAGTTYYGFNGTNFVELRSDGGANNVAAHRCWLEISGNANAHSLSILWPDGSTTGITLTPILSEGEGDWYDLNGRKLSNSKLSNSKLPKGVYIKNGKKQVVK